MEESGASQPKALAFDVAGSTLVLVDRFAPSVGRSTWANEDTQVFTRRGNNHAAEKGHMGAGTYRAHAEEQAEERVQHRAAQHVGPHLGSSAARSTKLRSPVASVECKISVVGGVLEEHARRGGDAVGEQCDGG